MSTSLLSDTSGRRVGAGSTPGSSTLRKILLVCGILAALLWVAADIAASLRYEGYSYTDQAISELSAAGAPTRAFLLPFLHTYTALSLLFAVGVWISAGSKRGLRITAGLLFTLGVMNAAIGLIEWIMGPVAAMHTREELSAAGGTAVTDMVHLIYAGVILLSVPLAIGFGATAFGKWWRVYSYATILLLVAFGVWTALDAPQVAANLPTPWMGLRERINAYGYMLWMLLLAIALLRAPKPPEKERIG